MSPNFSNESVKVRSNIHGMSLFLIVSGIFSISRYFDYFLFFVREGIFDFETFVFTIIAVAPFLISFLFFFRKKMGWVLLFLFLVFMLITAVMNIYTDYLLRKMGYQGASIGNIVQLVIVALFLTNISFTSIIQAFGISRKVYFLVLSVSVLIYSTYVYQYVVNLGKY